MAENIFVGVLVVIAIVAGIWGWRLEHCGLDKDSSTEKKIVEKDGENT